MKYLGSKANAADLATQGDITAGGSGVVTFDNGAPTGTGSSGDYYVEVDSESVVFEIWTSDGTEWTASGISFLTFPLPAGGDTGEVLAKSSDDDYALEWSAGNLVISSSAPSTSVLWADTTDNASVPAQTINTQTAAYTLVSGDAAKLITVNSSSAVNVTVNTTTALATGQRIDIAQIGSGQVTVVASGVTINATPGLKLRAQYSSASLFCLSSNNYLLVGDLAA
jgi:hypothetical protein